MLNNQGALLIYKSKILPYVDYGDVFYNGANQKYLDRLQKLQNRALRICLKTEERTSVKQIHKLASLPELKYRRIAHLRKIPYIRSKMPKYQLVRTRNTRRNDAIQLQYWLARNNRVANSLFNQCARTWNVLDPVIRNTPTIKEFKLKQKKWLKSCIPIT